MGRKMLDLLGKIGAVDVLFQRLVDQRRDHEAERHVDEHVAAVVDCGIEIRIGERGVKGTKAYASGSIKDINLIASNAQHFNPEMQTLNTYTYNYLA